MTTTLGFSGTRQGMTTPQFKLVEFILLDLYPDEVHHGDCDGSDKEFHDLVRNILPSCLIVIHPGCNRHGHEPTRAHCEGDLVLPTKPYLVRDKDIARAGRDGLIATPHTAHEVLRSGTWATVRYARQLKRELYVVSPEGILN